jgi:hypothetical protein
MRILRILRILSLQSAHRVQGAYGKRVKNCAKAATAGEMSRWHGSCLTLYAQLGNQEAHDHPVQTTPTGAAAK